MTTPWSGAALSEAIEAFAPGSVENSQSTDVWIKPDSIANVCEGLKTRPEFKFDLLNSVTAVDYIDHFEVVYHLTSLPMNASAILKWFQCGGVLTIKNEKFGTLWALDLKVTRTTSGSCSGKVFQVILYVKIMLRTISRFQRVSPRQTNSGDHDTAGHGKSGSAAPFYTRCVPHEGDVRR